MRADRAAMAVVADSERQRRVGIITTYEWLVVGGQTGPMSDGPATEARVQEELLLARLAARGAQAGRYDARAWRALGVVQFLEYALGLRSSVPTTVDVGRLAA